MTSSVLSDLIVKSCTLADTARVGKPIFSSDWAFLYNMRGTMRIEFEDDSGATVSVPVGEGVFVVPYTAAKLYCECTLCHIEFESKFLHKLWGKGRAVKSVRPSRQTVNCIEALGEYEYDERAFGLKCGGVLLFLLAEMQGEAEKGFYGQHRSVAGILRYMAENYDKNISIEGMCRDLSISLSACNKLMLKHYGVSPRQYLITYRLQKAKELLRNTDSSIESIARFVGYEYCGHFCNEFKRKVGLTPMEYRNKIYLNE